MLYMHCQYYTALCTVIELIDVTNTTHTLVSHTPPCLTLRCPTHTPLSHPTLPLALTSHLILSRPALSYPTNAGIGSNEKSVVSSSEYDKNRIEVLRVMIAAFSDSLYQVSATDATRLD